MGQSHSTAELNQHDAKQSLYDRGRVSSYTPTLLRHSPISYDEECFEVPEIVITSPSDSDTESSMQDARDDRPANKYFYEAYGPLDHIQTPMSMEMAEKESASTQNDHVRRMGRSHVHGAQGSHSQLSRSSSSRRSSGGTSTTDGGTATITKTEVYTTKTVTSPGKNKDKKMKKSEKDNADHGMKWKSPFKKKKKVTSAAPSSPGDIKTVRKPDSQEQKEHDQKWHDVVDELTLTHTKKGDGVKRQKSQRKVGKLKNMEQYDNINNVFSKGLALPMKTTPAGMPTRVQDAIDANDIDPHTTDKSVSVIHMHKQVIESNDSSNKPEEISHMYSYKENFKRDANIQNKHYLSLPSTEKQKINKGNLSSQSMKRLEQNGLNTESRYLNKQDSGVHVTPSHSGIKNHKSSHELHNTDSIKTDDDNFILSVGGYKSSEGGQSTLTSQGIHAENLPTVTSNTYVQQHTYPSKQNEPGGNISGNQLATSITKDDNNSNTVLNISAHSPTDLNLSSGTMQLNMDTNGQDALNIHRGEHDIFAVERSRSLNGYDKHGKAHTVTLNDSHLPAYAKINSNAGAQVTHHFHTDVRGLTEKQITEGTNKSGLYYGNNIGNQNISALLNSDYQSAISSLPNIKASASQIANNNENNAKQGSITVVTSDDSPSLNRHYHDQRFITNQSNWLLKDSSSSSPGPLSPLSSVSSHVMSDTLERSNQKTETFITDDKDVKFSGPQGAIKMMASSATKPMMSSSIPLTSPSSNYPFGNATSNSTDAVDMKAFSLTNMPFEKVTKDGDQVTMLYKADLSNLGIEPTDIHNLASSTLENKINKDVLRTVVEEPPPSGVTMNDDGTPFVTLKRGQSLNFNVNLHEQQNSDLIPSEKQIVEQYLPRKSSPVTSVDPHKQIPIKSDVTDLVYVPPNEPPSYDLFFDVDGRNDISPLRRSQSSAGREIEVVREIAPLRYEIPPPPVNRRITRRHSSREPIRQEPKIKPARRKPKEASHIPNEVIRKEVKPVAARMPSPPPPPPPPPQEEIVPLSRPRELQVKEDSSDTEVETTTIEERVQRIQMAIHEEIEFKLERKQGGQTTESQSMHASDSNLPHIPYKPVVNVEKRKWKTTRVKEMGVQGHDGMLTHALGSTSFGAIEMPNTLSKVSEECAEDVSGLFNQMEPKQQQSTENASNINGHLEIQENNKAKQHALIYGQSRDHTDQDYYYTEGADFDQRSVNEEKIIEENYIRNKSSRPEIEQRSGNDDDYISNKNMSPEYDQRSVNEEEIIEENYIRNRTVRPEYEPEEMTDRERSTSGRHSRMSSGSAATDRSGGTGGRYSHQSRSSSRQHSLEHHRKPNPRSHSEHGTSDGSLSRHSRQSHVHGRRSKPDRYSDTDGDSSPRSSERVYRKHVQQAKHRQPLRRRASDMTHRKRYDYMHYPEFHSDDEYYDDEDDYYDHDRRRHRYDVIRQRSVPDKVHIKNAPIRVITDEAGNIVKITETNNTSTKTIEFLPTDGRMTLDKLLSSGNISAYVQRQKKVPALKEYDEQERSVAIYDDDGHPTEDLYYKYNRNTSDIRRIPGYRRDSNDSYTLGDLTITEL